MKKPQGSSNEIGRTAKVIAGEYQGRYGTVLWVDNERICLAGVRGQGRMVFTRGQIKILFDKRET